MIASRAVSPRLLLVVRVYGYVMVGVFFDCAHACAASAYPARMRRVCEKSRFGMGAPVRFVVGRFVF